MNTETTEPKQEEEIKFDRRKHLIYEYTGKVDQGFPVVTVTVDPMVAKASEMKEAFRKAAMSEEEKAAIAREILILKQARNALSDALNTSPRTYYWSNRVGVQFDPETSERISGRIYWRGSELDWIETLDAVLLMGKAAQWQPETQLYLVTSPENVELIEQMRNFQVQKVEYNELPIDQVGLYRGMKVMIDAYFPTDKILVAKGNLTIPGALNIISSTNIKIITNWDQTVD
jgi:hypothetical protein